MTQPNFYALLNLNPGASTDEIEARIRQRLGEARRLVNHPDRGREAAQAMQSLREARQVLLDPAQKQRYDQMLPRPFKPLAPISTLVPLQLQKLSLIALGFILGLLTGWLFGSQARFESYF